MTVITMRQLLEAGVHFGHQKKHWNPKMAPFIYSSRNDIHVIDLHKSIPFIERAYEFIKKIAADNGRILFVGTKKQAQEAIEAEAKRCGMFYVKERWLGGTLTNFKTLRKNISRLRDIEKKESSGILEKLPKKEVSNILKEKTKLLKVIGGVREMNALPQALFIVDSKKELIAVKEARKLGIPVVGIVDTNCDPNDVDYPIPANDDAIRSVKLLVSIIADAVMDGRQLASPGEKLEISIDGEMTDEIDVAKELEKEEEIGSLVPVDFSKEDETE